MAIKTQAQEAIMHLDPFSMVSDIRVLSGNPVQNYNKDTEEYEPDRSLVPCLLMPYVSIVDPEGTMKGEQAITGVEWYEGSPLPDGSNRISGSPDYIISDTDTPKYSLKIKKNIDPNVPVEIHAIFTFTDKNRNEAVTVERSIILRTSLFDSQNYSVKLDVPKGWSVDPIRVQPDASGKWLYKINAQLYSGKEVVKDSNAAYWWRILDSGAYRDFTQEEKNLVVSGENTKTLTIDARFIQNASFQVRAAYYEGSVRPQSPTCDELQQTTTVNVSMPHTLRISQRQTKGYKVKISQNTLVGYEVVITDNKEIIGPEHDNLFNIVWKGVSTRPGSIEKVIGNGRNIEFTPEEVGLEARYPFKVWAEVELYRSHSTTLSEGKLLTDDNKAVIAVKYE